MFRTTFAIFLMLPLVAHGENLTDPMRPSDAEPARSEAPAAAARYELSAILYSPDRRVAIVNGRSVREGQRVGRARVARIRRGRVELDLGDRRLTLALATPPNKTTSRSP